MFLIFTRWPWQKFRRFSMEIGYLAPSLVESQSCSSLEISWPRSNWKGLNFFDLVDNIALMNDPGEVSFFANLFWFEEEERRINIGFTKLFVTDSCISFRWSRTFLDIDAPFYETRLYYFINVEKVVVFESCCFDFVEIAKIGLDFFFILIEIPSSRGETTQIAYSLPKFDW